MRAYDPDRSPDAAEWLAIDEQERIALVEAFHISASIQLPSLTAHAAFHAMVENQLAAQHPPVVRAMARLAKQGLSRHDCVHAVSWVLAQHFHELMTATTSEPTAVVQARFDAAVERLTAAGWRAQVEE